MQLLGVFLLGGTLPKGIRFTKHIRCFWTHQFLRYYEDMINYLGESNHHTVTIRALKVRCPDSYASRIPHLLYKPKSRGPGTQPEAIVKKVSCHGGSFFCSGSAKKRPKLGE